MARFEPYSTAPVPERAVLVGVESPSTTSAWTLEESLDELGRLAHTDGAEVVSRLTQRQDRPNPKTFIGSGKVAELDRLVRALEADVVIFDDELTPSQQANLERALPREVKVIDRTALILDIFGNHAATREGRLQVQLAQLEYLYPRLRGMWSHLAGNQTRGGIGSRFGQGESQLEVDRRLVRSRITALRRELADLEKRRDVQGKARRESGVFRVALVGYTNAGKSTLLNRLTGANVYAKDELFATLDPTTRRLVLDLGRRVAVTDTVGFIQKLPTTLVEAFKSTLKEVAEADLLLVVADASDSHAELQLKAVDDVLKQIGAQGVPRVTVYNKRDLLDERQAATLESAHAGAVLVSAAEGTGLDALLMRVTKEASARETTLRVLIPFSKGGLVQQVHERCRVVRESYTEDGFCATVRAGAPMAQLLAPYAVTE